MRIASGYDRVPDQLALGYGDRIVMETIVERIACIEFSPPLAVLDEARSRLTMGAVVRVVLLFRERWWTGTLPSVPRGGSLDSLSFLHGAAGDVPVWWSLHPAHVPVMVGWAGGPAAEGLSGRTPAEIRDRAVAALAANLGVSRRRIKTQLEECWTHDWQHDPFSRGAYSYALVGGSDWATRLARPVERTLWLAGEAADSEGRNGTVHGAIGSGRRAAQSLLRALA
jgi:monoamine oxidase